MDLDRQLTKWKQALAEVERRLQVASSAALSAQHNTLAKAVKANKCHVILADVEHRLGAAQVAASKARDDNKTAKVEAFKFEGDHVA